MYQLFREPGLGETAAREVVSALSERLAERIREQLGSFSAQRVLLLPILRGGLLMYPAFSKLFRSAAVGLVQIVRNGDDREVVYENLPPGIQPEVVLYLDPVASTGRTIQRAARLLFERYRASKHIACVIAAAREVKGCLRAANVDLEGISTDEESLDGLVVPDLGARDAGDLAFLPTTGSPIHPASPITAFEKFHLDQERAQALRSELIYGPIIDFVCSHRFSNILDLGCGAGRLTRTMAKHARIVVGYDTSEEAINLARRESSHDNIVYTTKPPNEIQQRFDLIVCCMVLNSTYALQDVMEIATKCSAPNSLQVWTVLHPAFQFNDSQWRARKHISSTSLSVTYSLLPSYFDEHIFEKRLGSIPLIEHHRPLSTYINTLARNGFRLVEMREPRPTDVSTSVVDYFVPRIMMFVTCRSTPQESQESQSNSTPNCNKETF